MKVNISKNDGFSLLELMVALGVLTIVIASIFKVLNVQISHTVKERSVTLSQTEAELSYSFFKWDFLMAGFGVPVTSAPFRTEDSLFGDHTTSIVLTGSALGPSRNNARWSYRVDFTQDSTSTPIVRFWNDTTRDLRMGDYVMLLSDRKEVIGGPYYIAYTEQRGSDSLLIQLDQLIAAPANIRAPIGSYFIALDSLGNYRSITYQVENEVLKRDDTPILENVVAFKVKFGFDDDGDGLIETWRESLSGLSASQIHSNLRLTRVSLVVRSKKKGRALISPQTIVFPDEPIVGEPVDTLELTHEERKYSYFVVTTLLRPRNL